MEIREIGKRLGFFMSAAWRSPPARLRSAYWQDTWRAVQHRVLQLYPLISSISLHLLISRSYTFRTGNTGTAPKISIGPLPRIVKCRALQECRPFSRPRPERYLTRGRCHIVSLFQSSQFGRIHCPWALPRAVMLRPFGSEYRNSSG